VRRRPKDAQHAEPVAPSDQPVIRPNAGGNLRGAGATPRLHYLEAEVTAEEGKQIVQYCLKHKTSVSGFLAELVLKDAGKANTAKGVVRIRDLHFPVEDYTKLELLAHLNRRNSVSELIRELLQPHIDLRRVFGPNDKAKSLRFYLNDDEHQKVTEYLDKRGVTARKYVAFIALKAIVGTKKNKK